MGNFLCDVERVKRFVKAHLHCIVRNLKKDRQNVDVAPHFEKFMWTSMAVAQQVFHKLVGRTFMPSDS